MSVTVLHRHRARTRKGSGSGGGDIGESEVGRLVAGCESRCARTRRRGEWRHFQTLRLTLTGTVTVT